MNSSSPSNSGRRTSTTLNGTEKPRLSEAEKKNNHIVSEQKRRQAIREGFDRLAAIVPGMQGQGRSEAVVLQATVDYIKAQMAKKEELRKQAHKKGIRDSEFEAAYNFAVEDRDVQELAAGTSNSGSGQKVKQEK